MVLLLAGARADDGATVPGQGLSLRLSDFALETCFADIPQ